jgi:hypothetical protein
VFARCSTGRVTPNGAVSTSVVRILGWVWRWLGTSFRHRLLAAIVVAGWAALVVLSFDVHARVDGSMTHCGGGLGVEVPYFEDPGRAFFSECEAAVDRSRVGAAAAATIAALTTLTLGEVARRRTISCR